MLNQLFSDVSDIAVHTQHKGKPLALNLVLRWAYVKYFIPWKLEMNKDGKLFCWEVGNLGISGQFK